MKTSKLTKSVVAMVAVLALAVPCVSNEQDSTLSEREAQLIYSRAYEATIWGSPALAVYSQSEANRRDLGADHLDIIYTGVPMDHRWGGITYNNQSPYFINHFSLKEGPVVVEIPPARPEARVFGSIADHWQIPLEDFGPAGEDEGKGGKYLVLPPGYDDEVPDGYIVLRSNSFLHWIPGRTIPRDKGQKGWDAAVAYLKTIRIYPLANPERPTRFVQGAQKKYDAQPQFDLSDFHLLQRMVQDEPIREHDKAMYGMLSTLGIEKGKKFDPSPEVAAILEKAAKDVQAYAISKIQSGEAFRQFWPDGVWGTFKLTPEVISTLGSFNFDEGLFYDNRLVNLFYFSGGMYKGFDPNKPAATAYVMTAQDSDRKPLDATKTYKINIPPNVPMKDFWSIILYGSESRTFLNSPKFTVSSSDEGVKVNSDGSVDLYLSPKPVKGFEANTVIMNPNEDAFLMFRFYGAKPELWKLKWKLGDPELIE
jgi:hypothetical protein